MAKTKIQVSATLDDFLCKQIAANPEYQLWARGYEIPRYITDNLHPTKRLREYQENALKHFIFLYDRDRSTAKHLLFNMATGTGKTLVMASVVLFLYEKGYRNFLFLVHQLQIQAQAIKNFTDYKFEKYLFNPKGIKINGRNIAVKQVGNVEEADSNAINFMFFSTALLYARLKEDHENALTAEMFKHHHTVIIADEAHRLNVDTRSKNKTDCEEARNWETAVISTVNAHKENMLLEFTATVDLANQAIHAKYKNKLIYRYDFLAFNKDGYSKDIKFLYNHETHIENQKRLLIVNAVALSEYRRLFAERVMGISIRPIVLIKSVSIAQSEADRTFFDNVIGSLRPEDLDHLRKFSYGNTDLEHKILSDMFKWLADPRNGLALTGEQENDGLPTFTAEIRASFAHDNTLIYNSQKKEKANLLPLLDSPRNTIRTIFSVNALNEGWDVLNLYDIVHFDLSEKKKVSLQDIQLIGRGARYNPYELPYSYKNKSNHEKDMMNMFAGGRLEFNKYKRKFDNAPYDEGRVLETLVYHFVKTGMFLNDLQRELLGEGIMNEGIDKKTITMKQKFLESDTYRKGFVLVNHPIKRTKTTDEEIDTTFKHTIKANSYRLQARGLSDREENQIIAGQKTQKIITITEQYFPLPIIRKALVSAEGHFFRFNNLCEHIKGIETIDILISEYLPKYEIQYTYENGKSIDELDPHEKLQLLVGVILPEIRKSIDLNMPKEIGSKKFRPVSLSQVFEKEKNIYLMSFPTHDHTGEKTFVSSDERAKAQSDHDNAELQYNIKRADWYAYNENYGTSEEKRFVKYIASQIDELRSKYEGAEIYLIRNELDYWLYSPQDGRRFSPDYLLIINDIKNHALYYQVIIEPKGGYLLDRDEWKEKVLISLNNDSEIVFDEEEMDSKTYKEYLKVAKKSGYKIIKPIGIKFYNADTQSKDFALDFQAKLLNS
ncbi:type III site-specific deoxyribonuclease [Candidatus Nitrosoglobus terrae]|uniref:Type III site-specific deoxyribonuclease n=1 Tax=Candidatus Nitrosoglobus terrae TaxID=1630141 RepID=A0A1Q2SNN3_9GAMM|nr:DEAD/DEAH box helicase family protein [Candidatus Nitrosoglobus terrae]BAW80713.1 type III site-specific deoxyribonuclease [Candidatus Nitrosoglobus terrae]